eukprot:scaffold31194_cov86-Isochrysis_galbana.AAC.1
MRRGGAWNRSGWNSVQTRHVPCPKRGMRRTCHTAETSKVQRDTWTGRAPPQPGSPGSSR